MPKLIHHSAKESHYDLEAEHYDAFNEDNSRVINRKIEKILRKHHVKTVVDLTCGTGSQVFALTKQGFDVVGSDINANMLARAKSKAKKLGLTTKFIKADMRTARLGKFEAAITIFNAVGHLTKSDFAKAMRNIAENLYDGGLYVFDIFNLDYLLHKDNITKFTIDWYKHKDHTKTRLIQYSTIDAKGVMASFTTQYEQNADGKSKVTKSKQTLQVYTADKLREMLEGSGFVIVKQYGVDGAKFDERKTERILMVARKEGGIRSK